MNIAASDLQPGQTFSTKHDKLSAIEAPKADRLDANGGYKVYVTNTAGEEFYHLFGANDMVVA